MATQSHSGRSGVADDSGADTRIAPWASKWDALPESPEVQSPPPVVRPPEATKAASAPVDVKPAPPEVRGVFASKLMAGVSAVSFILLAGLIVICWPDISRALG